MEAARKFIQIIRFALAGAVVMYLLVVLRLPSSAKANPIILRVLTFVGVSMAILILVMRRIQVLPAEAILQNQPEDKRALTRLRVGYLITYSLSLSIALYGLVLHFLGFPISQVVPFLIAGFALILYYGPKPITSNTLQPQSGSIKLL